jgi:histidine triad (HIT) family protein
VSSCIFCKIGAKEVSSTIVYDDGELVAFRDLNPQAPTHILVIPARHIESLHAAEPSDEGLLGRMLLAARSIAEKEGIAKAGYRVVMNSGPAGGQTVSHVHLHLLGGRPMSWPPG